MKCYALKVYVMSAASLESMANFFFLIEEMIAHRYRLLVYQDYFKKNHYISFLDHFQTHPAAGELFTVQYCLV